MEYKGKIKLNGIEHDVEVIDNVHYIDGINVIIWLEKANYLELKDLNIIGENVFIDKVTETKDRKYQDIADKEYIKRSN